MGVVDLDEPRARAGDQPPRVLDGDGRIASAVDRDHAGGDPGRKGAEAGYVGQTRAAGDQLVRGAEEDRRARPRAAAKEIQGHRASERRSHDDIDGVGAKGLALDLDASAEHPAYEPAEYQRPRGDQSRRHPKKEAPVCPT